MTAVSRSRQTRTCQAHAWSQQARRLCGRRADHAIAEVARVFINHGDKTDTRGRPRMIYFAQTGAAHRQQVCERTIRYQLAALIAAGVLVRATGRRHQDAGGLWRREANAYRLAWPPRQPHTDPPGPVVPGQSDRQEVAAHPPSARSVHDRLASEIPPPVENRPPAADPTIQMAPTAPLDHDQHAVEQEPTVRWTDRPGGWRYWVTVAAGQDE